MKWIETYNTYGSLQLLRGLIENRYVFSVPYVLLKTEFIIRLWASQKSMPIKANLSINWQFKAFKVLFSSASICNYGDYRIFFFFWPANEANHGIWAYISDQH